jgi:hypothetical protein
MVHLCLVMEALDASVGGLFSIAEIYRERLPLMGGAIAIAAQLARAVTKLHKRGIIHGGKRIVTSRLNKPLSTPVKFAAHRNAGPSTRNGWSYARRHAGKREARTEKLIG